MGHLDISAIDEVCRNLLVFNFSVADPGLPRLGRQPKVWGVGPPTYYLHKGIQDLGGWA